MQNVGWTFHGSDEWTDSAVPQGKTDDAVLCYHDRWGLLFAIVLCGEVMTPRVMLQIIRPIDACFTFNTQVKELVRLSLNQPVKLFVDSNTDTAYNLRQEFVRIRTKHEGDREAIVAGMYVTLLDCGLFTLCVLPSSFVHSIIPWSLFVVSEHQKGLPSHVYHSWITGPQGSWIAWQLDNVTGIQLWT